MSHKRRHSFTGMTDHDFTGLISGQLIEFDGTNIVSAGSGSTFNSFSGATDVDSTAMSGVLGQAVPFYDSSLGLWTTDQHVNAESTVILAVAFSGATLSAGTPVYIVDMNSDVVRVLPTSASGSTQMPCVGIVAENMNTVDPKHIVTFGKMDFGDTSAWSVDDNLYVSEVTGELTTTRPVGPNAEVQRIAKVLKSSVSGGQVFVYNSSRTAGLPNLETGRILFGDSNSYPVEKTLNELNIITGSGISNYVTKWDTTASGITNSSIFDNGSYVTTPFFSATTMSAQTIHVANLSGFSPININSSMHVEDNGNVGVGTVSPNATLDIESTTAATNSLIVDTDTFIVTKAGVVSSKNGYHIDSNNAFDLNISSATLGIGYNFGDVDSVGINNTMIGHNIGDALTSGHRNTLIGYNAGTNLTSGSFNTFIGNEAGQAFSTASYNTAIGSGALKLATASSNTAIGGNAGEKLTSAIQSVLIGRQCGFNITTGGNNIGIGYRALNNITTGTKNIGIGNFANLTNNVSSTVSIGFNSAPTANNQWVVGSPNYTLSEFYWGRGIEGSASSQVTTMDWYHTSIQDGASVNEDLISKDWVFHGARGTGTGNGGNIAFSIAPPGTSGSTQNSSVEQIRIHGTGEGVEFKNKVGIGISAPSSSLHIVGDGSTNATTSLLIENSSSNPLLNVDDDGSIGIGTSSPSEELHILGNEYIDGQSTGSTTLRIDGAGTTATGSTDDQSLALRVNQSNGSPIFVVRNDRRAAFSPTTGFGGVLIPTNVSLAAYGKTSNSSEQAFLVANSSTNPILRVRNDRRISIASNSFNDASLSVYRDAGTTHGIVVPEGTVGVNVTSPNSTLQVDGSVSVGFIATGNSVSTTSEVFIGITDTASPRTVTIQSSDIVSGRIFVIKDQSGSASGGEITIATQGSENIDGVSTATINTDYGVVRLYSDGSNLFTW